MRAKAIGPLLGAAAVAALLLPGGARAEGPASRGAKSEVTESLSLQGTTGYSVDVSLVDHRKLSLEASSAKKGQLGVRIVTYSLHALQRHGSDDIDARLGSLGRIDLRFVPESVEETPQVLPFCTGGKTLVEKGHFVGFISFRGERDYTRAHATRAAGTVSTEPGAVNCHGQKKAEAEAEHKAEKEEREPELLQLTAVVAHRHIAFSTTRLTGEFQGRPKSITSFVALGFRRRGAIREVSTTLIALAKGSYFQSPDPLQPTQEAVIAPPAPFTGSATFRRESPTSAASWTGDLGIELLGFGNVALAGKGVHATMCEGAACQSADSLSLPFPS